MVPYVRVLWERPEIRNTYSNDGIFLASWVASSPTALRNEGVGAASRNDGIFSRHGLSSMSPFGVASTLLDCKAFAST